MNTRVSSVITSAPFLGPVTVVDVGPQLLVELPSGEQLMAEMALSHPYAPVVGDSLLVIGNAGGHWVIGVVAGRGGVTMCFDGDIDVRAGGKLSLSGGAGVHITGAALDVMVDKLTVAAKSSLQKFDALYQRVRSVLSVNAGEAHTHVEGTSLQRAKKHALVAEETASVNGKQILLG